MAYDAQAPAEVTARDRVIQLRDFLETLPPEKFNLFAWGEPDYVAHACRTPACIAGWGDALFFGRAAGPSWCDMVERLADHLGLSEQQAHDLFQSTQGEQDAPYDAKPRHAVVVLDHYLATGKISWAVRPGQLRSDG